MNANQQTKRVEPSKKGVQNDGRTTNYKNLISQYYDKDLHLQDVHEQIKSITPQIEIFDQLNEFQKQIDSLVKTKRYDVQQLFMKPPKQLKRVFRLHVTKFQGKLQIFGGLFPQKQYQSAPKFTNFFKQVKIYAGLEKTVIQNWKKPISNSSSNFIQKDGISLNLNDAQNQNLFISLTQIFNPQRFQVDQNLRKIVNIKRGTRVEVLQAFWEYVKAKKLQDMDNKEIVNADDLIRNAFKTEKLTFATINYRIRELLVSVEPIKMELKSNQTKKTFDIIVLVQQRLSADIVPFFSQKLNQQKNDHPYLSLNSKIKKYQKKFSEHTQKLRRHLSKREIYKNFKPQKIEDIIKEQYELLKQIKKNQPIDQFNKLEYILNNEDQVEKEIKHYIQQVNLQRSQIHQ